VHAIDFVLDDADRAAQAQAEASRRQQQAQSQVPGQANVVDVDEPRKPFDLSKQSPLARMFDLSLISGEWKISCSLPCGVHPPGETFAAIVASKSKDGGYLPKASNIKSHIALNHNRPWPREKWQATQLDTHTPAVKSAIATAVSVREITRSTYI
jgi:hypothetical protein